MELYVLSNHDKYLLKALGEDLAKNFPTADCNQFLNRAFLYSKRLPFRLLDRMIHLKQSGSHSGVLVIKGYDLGGALPPTPITWRRSDTYIPNAPVDYLSVILSSILGDPFGFETQQEGKLIHDVLPIKGDEYFQAGSNSLGQLNFHTEDAFHLHRGIFICFCCLKNPCNTGTSGVSIDDLIIPDNYKKVLFQKRYYTLSDNTHRCDIKNLQYHSVFFGNTRSPYICIDVDFTFAKEGDSLAKEALDYLYDQVNSNLTIIPLQPGDFCFIDNYKWLHGRKPFKANYDGNDRWLKRLNICADLKSSTQYRIDASSRLIHPEPITTADF